ncbi:MBL fold metallo-hydrolase [Halobacteriovorax sp. HLS]|uniref:MBL fold metallo-hydrolase n=1 Tax=Halobacteriovorax sp. HLS TaxID=2234000 RepID=UPI0013E2C628|nr:MBL fold metallo-hydrolase [Halobacteriovorax sp. HLS]
MYGIIPKPLWNKVHPSDELNRIDLALRLLVIKDQDRVILIDTGIGDYNGDKFNSRFDVRTENSPLEKSLAKINLTTDDITDLILSHLHFDHIGGIAQMEDSKLVPIFKNARCHIHKQHYDYALSPSLRDAGSFHTHNFGPILDWYVEQGKMVWHTGEEGTIFNDGNKLSFKCSHGHTPFLMHPYDDNFIYLADLIPTSNHIHIPWVMGYDINPGVTTTDKVTFLEFIEENNLTIIYEHDPIYWGSKTLKGTKGIEVKDLSKAPKELAYKLEF